MRTSFCFVVVGLDIETGKVADWYCVCHSSKRAEELCAEAHEDNMALHRLGESRLYNYTYYATLEEEDD